MVQPAVIGQFHVELLRLKRVIFNNTVARRHCDRIQFMREFHCDYIAKESDLLPTCIVEVRLIASYRTSQC